MRILISEITVNAGRREAVPEDVRVLADSMAEVGLITPITLDCMNTLIAGLHRLEAAMSTPTRKCRFSPEWNVIFRRSACGWYAALITHYLPA